METAETEANSHIHEILKPLHHEGSSYEYLHQFKGMVEFDRRMRALERLYMELYTQASNLENVVLEHKKN